MKRLVPLVCLCACLVPAARAQFAFSVNGQAVGTTYNFGTVSPGMTASASFQLQNTSNAATSVTSLNAAGPGFNIPSLPSLPQTLNPQGTVTFTVTFQGTLPPGAPYAGYSASLRVNGVPALLLTAAVVPGLTFQVQTASGTQNLGASAAIDFGAVSIGSTSSVQFGASNGTSQSLTVPAITVSGSDFSLLNQVSGTSVQPGGQVTFSVQFQPSAAGTRSGTITIGGNSYALAGTGSAAPLPPQPHINILLAEAQSQQQGAVTITFDSPAPSSGSGTVALAFQPAGSGAVDSAIAFASGSQSVTFTFSAGDIQATFGAARSVAFQTGTTAGVIQFTVQIGNLSDQQSVTIPPATVSVTGIQANRYAGSVAVEITGFDNTRSTGQLSFAFYDFAGDLIAPGTIPVNATTAFTQYFSSSQGGAFLLSATFPVTGDASQITYVQVAFSNSAGTSTSLRTSLQ